MGNINRTNFELIVELRKQTLIKVFFFERQRGHWRGIDSRKLPSAEKSFWENKNLNEDFL